MVLEFPLKKKHSLIFMSERDLAADHVCGFDSFVILEYSSRYATLLYISKGFEHLFESCPPNKSCSESCPLGYILYIILYNIIHTDIQAAEKHVH